MGKSYYQKLKPRIKSLKKRWRNHQRSQNSLTSQPEHHKHCFKTQNHLSELQQTPLAPNAPLNTTSYIIEAKARYVNSPLQDLSFPDFDIYGSMKGLLGIEFAGEVTGDSDSLSGESNGQGAIIGGGIDLLHPPMNAKIRHNFLALRITKQDNQIAHLEEESSMLKERMFCMEEELGGLKQRVRILELSNELSLVNFHEGDASFA